ncbi:MAG: putative WD repeat domain 16, partial [Streblomastix strix]
SGRLLYVINDAHKKVTSITTFHNSPAIVSGGSEGQVRLWKLGRDSQQLIATMKEHRMAVTAVRVTQDDLECVSSGSDGQMLTWSLTRHIRLKQMIKTANFQGVDYLPDNSQFIACGSDRFATYFDAFEGKQLREVELSDKELFDIAVDPSGMKFALVGADQLVKLVDYDEGKIMHLGRGHPDSITCVTWSPDGAHIVSGSADGSIFIWQAPR